MNLSTRIRQWLTGGDNDDVSDNSERYLIVGLGNPGREYKHNRHNLGFMVIDRIAETNHISLGKVQNKAIVGLGRVRDVSVVLAKPQTYMNSSGDAVGPLARYYKIPNERVMVIYDELDLPFGSVRLREKGGAGGHNGMKSIINHLGNEFARMRLGIGRPPGKMPASAWVLRDFGQDEMETVTVMVDSAEGAVETFLTEDIQQAMTRFNTTSKS